LKQNHIKTGKARQHLTNMRLREMVINKHPGQTYSLKQIADYCLITKERVRQIEMDALKKLRLCENTKLWKELSY